MLTKIYDGAAGKVFVQHGRVYVPVLIEDRMQAYTVVSYGQMSNKGKFLLQVYVLVKAANAELNYRTYRLTAYSETMENFVSEAEQLARADLMMCTVATMMGHDFKIYQPTKTRRPK